MAVGLARRAGHRRSAHMGTEESPLGTNEENERNGGRCEEGEGEGEDRQTSRCQEPPLSDFRSSLVPAGILVAEESMQT